MREGSRFAQLVQHRAVPSWMHGTNATPASRASAPSRASFRMDLASDVLSQIGASTDAPQHTSARAAPSKAAAAAGILALLEANLKPPSLQHVRPALDNSSAHRHAADAVREGDRLFTPAPSREAMSPQHGGANAVYVSKGAMQQLLPRPRDLVYHSHVQQQPLAVGADADTAWRPMQENDGWIMDIPALSGAQSSGLGEVFPTDHRCDRFTNMYRQLKAWEDTSMQHPAHSEGDKLPCIRLCFRRLPASS